MKNSKTLVVRANSTSEYGDGPVFAVIDSPDVLLAKVKGLQQVIVDFGLSEVRIISSPEAWGPGDIEDELRLQCPELVVCSTSFWFTDNPKHCSWNIETTAMDVALVEKAIVESEGEIIYFGHDHDDLRAVYLESIEVEDDDEEGA